MVHVVGVWEGGQLAREAGGDHFSIREAGGTPNYLGGALQYEIREAFSPTCKIVEREVPGGANFAHKGSGRRDEKS